MRDARSEIGIGRVHLARGLATNLDKSQPHPSRNSYRASRLEKWRLKKLFAFSSSAFLPWKVPLTAITAATVMEAKNAVVVHASIRVARVITAILTASVVEAKCAVVTDASIRAARVITRTLFGVVVLLQAL